jgi:hypothetical protein
MVEGLIFAPPNPFAWKGFYNQIGVLQVVGILENT